jgi:tripartite-type tricarboxylate transporter receptor subunit TctC
MPKLFSRRTVLACLAFLALASGTAQAADEWPSRTIRIVVGSPAGGSMDFLARLLSKPLGEALGQSVVVENKAGGSGNIGHEYVANAKPDGYTLLMGYNGFLVANPHLFKQIRWDPIKSFAPIGLVARSPQLMVIKPDAPYSNFEELISFGKANPGTINYASSGIGSVPHVAAALLEQSTGTKMTHVPFKGAGDAVQALAANTVDLYITSPAGVMGQVKSSLIRAIAVSGDKRLETLPEVPSTSELGLPNYALDSWFAIYAPAGVDADVVTKLSEALRAVLGSPEIVQKVRESGMEVGLMSPQELEQFTKDEFVRWGEIIRSADMTRD